MRRAAVIILFLVTLIAVVCLNAFSNPSNLPECFVESKGGVQDLTNLCGSKSPDRPQTSPTQPTANQSKRSSNAYNKTRNGVTVNLPSDWKLFPDGSISPSPGILVPSLYDIDD